MRTFARHSLFPFSALILCVLSMWAPASGDEGMWTFDNPPDKLLQDKYGFTATKDWLDRVRLASVRFNDGGSGSFVSPSGLVLTNHHVALGQLQKVSTPQKNYVEEGFYARTAAEEMRCPDLELNVLVSVEDVTQRVQQAVKPGMNDKDAYQARKEQIARMERESTESTGLRSDVVTLYTGGEYWLYRYKKYTDVRLVFAPEQQIAFFGGDPDNFTYPRYDLDMALFRVYENEKSVTPGSYLKWNPQGAAAGELVFVSGNPGSTERLQTVTQLDNQRDYFLPGTIKLIKRRLATLRAYAARGPEPAREATNQIFSLENSLKAYDGEYSGLLDKNLMAKKQKEEADFRTLVRKDPAWEKKYGAAWQEITQAEKAQVGRLKQIRYRSLRAPRIMSTAITIVQYVAETRKPDGQRLDGFHESQLESLRFRLLSPAPYYLQMDEVLIADGLKQSIEELGPDDPYVKAVLNGKSPEEIARQVAQGTKLASPDVRKPLIAGGEAAVNGSTDPAIELARKIDPFLRENEKWQEDNVLSIETAAGEKIGAARFAVYGKTTYPDATFTLRLSYGTVAGYPMNGTQAPPKTTFFGLYDRADSFDRKPPYNLPRRYIENAAAIDLSTPLNFVNTCDIIGGNSGSPVINRAGEIVGLIFDGNIESLVGNYVYDIERNRAVAVHTAAMTEALRKIYGAGALADELQGTPR
jgi:hypothetical protein